MNMLTNAISDLCNKLTLDISPTEKYEQIPQKIKVSSRFALATR